MPPAGSGVAEICATYYNKKENMNYTIKADERALSNLLDTLSRGCKNSQIIRELLWNAIEAILRYHAQLGVEPKGVVTITKDKLDPRKALFCNSLGDALTRAIVGAHLVSLGSSGNTDEEGDNFGIGAKVAYLPNNPLGLIYRCRTEMMQFQFGKNENNCYGLIPEEVELIDEEGNLVDTEWADFPDIRPDEFTLPDSETEVKMLGSAEDEDTWKQICKFAGAEHAGTDPWSGHTIADFIEQRMWALPCPGIEIRVSIYNEAGDEISQRLIRPLKDIIHSYPVSGKVELSSGVNIHYFAKKFNKGVKLGDRRRTGYVGCVVGRESYVDTAISPSSRQKNMSEWGIFTHHKHIGIYAELPEELGFRPQPNRCSVRGPNGEVPPLSDYAEEFRRNIPENLKQWMSELHTPHNSTIQDEMNRLFRKTATASSTQGTGSSRKTSVAGGSVSSRGSLSSGTSSPRRRKKTRAAGIGSNKTSTAPEFLLQSDGADSPAVTLDTTSWVITVNMDSPLFLHRFAKLRAYKGAPDELLKTTVGETMYQVSCLFYIEARNAHASGKSMDAIHRDIEGKFDSCYDETRAKQRLTKQLNRVERTEEASAA